MDLNRFAFDGLPALIVHILISEASHIKRMNSNGVQKMMRNILALQQNLANFVPPSQNSVMERAREYYQLFNLGSEVIIKLPVGIWILVYNSYFLIDTSILIYMYRVLYEILVKMDHDSHLTNIVLFLD